MSGFESERGQGDKLEPGLTGGKEAHNKQKDSYY
jgi:hypothetical protein